MPDQAGLYVQLASVGVSLILVLITWGYLRATNRLVRITQAQAANAAQQVWVARDQWLSELETRAIAAQYDFESLGARLRNQTLGELGSGFHLDAKPEIETVFDMLIESVRNHRSSLAAYLGADSSDLQYLLDTEERWTDLKDTRIFVEHDVADLRFRVSELQLRVEKVRLGLHAAVASKRKALGPPPFAA